MSDGRRAMKARHQFRRRFSLQPSFLKEDADEEELSLKVNSRSTSRVNEESSSSGARHKVVVLGAAKTGKSSLILRFLYGTFSPKYRRTVEEMHHADLGPGLALDILDTAGAYEFPAMRALSMAKGEAFILVYDVTDEATFHELRGLRAQILDTKPGAPIVVVANKLDLLETPGAPEAGTVHDLDQQHAAEVTQQWEHGYVRTSAKDDLNVSQVFKELLVQAKVRYNLSPALLRRRTTTLARHSISAGASSLVPSAQQIEHLQQLQQRHGKRNSCNIS